MRAHKTLGTTLTVASLTLTALMGQSAFATDTAAVPTATASASSGAASEQNDSEKITDGMYLDFVYSGAHNVQVGQSYTAVPEFWTQGMTGEKTTAPAGVTYEIVKISNPNLQATINSTTNEMTFGFSTGNDGETGAITVRANFADGSSTDFDYQVTVGQKEESETDDPTASDLIEMWYGDNQVPVVAGKDHVLSPTFYIPTLSSSDSFEIPGATFELVNSSADLNARIDSATGEVTVRFDQLPTVETKYNYTVRITFADGTTYEETFDFTLTDLAAVPSTSSPTPEPTESAAETPAPADPSSTVDAQTPAAVEAATPEATEAVYTSNSSISDNSASYQSGGNQDGGVQQSSATTPRAELAETGAKSALVIFFAGLLALASGVALVLRRKH